MEYIYNDNAKLLLTCANVEAPVGRSAFLLDLDVIREDAEPIGMDRVMRTVDDLHDREGRAFGRSRRRSPTRRGRSSVKLEIPALWSASNSNAYQPDLSTVLSSGSGGRPLMEMVAERGPKLGASAFSHACVHWMAVLVSALASSVSLTTDSVMACFPSESPSRLPTC